MRRPERQRQGPTETPNRSEAEDQPEGLRGGGLGFRGSWRPRGLSKWVISRIISTLNGVTLIITLLITH